MAKAKNWRLGVAKTYAPGMGGVTMPRYVSSDTFWRVEGEPSSSPSVVTFHCRSCQYPVSKQFYTVSSYLLIVVTIEWIGNNRPVIVAIQVNDILRESSASQENGWHCRSEWTVVRAGTRVEVWTSDFCRCLYTRRPPRSGLTIAQEA